MSDAGRASHARLAALPVLALGLMATLQPWLASRRPPPVELRAPREIVVTSSADAGPGSLRQAIIDAGSAATRVRIVLDTPQVVLDDPLPPLIQPRGIVVDGGATGCVIEARRLLTGGAFQVTASDSALSGLTIRGAPSFAVLVRADRVRLVNLEVTQSGDGVRVAAGVRDLVVEGSRFRANEVGLRLLSDGPGVLLRRNHFSDHADAAVWAARANLDKGAALAGGVRITQNRFERDRISLVLANVPVTVELNEVLSAFEAAVYLAGRGAVVRGNRIRDAALVGIRGENVHGGLLTGNEIDHNQVAVLLSRAQDMVVDGNRIYANGVGVAVVLAPPSNPSVLSANLLLSHRGDGALLVGSSPVLRGNRSFGNRGAGLRMQDFVPAGEAAVRSQPRLEANLFTGNGADQVRDEHHVAGSRGMGTPEDESVPSSKERR